MKLKKKKLAFPRRSVMRSFLTETRSSVDIPWNHLTGSPDSVSVNRFNASTYTLYKKALIYISPFLNKLQGQWLTVVRRRAYLGRNILSRSRVRRRWKCRQWHCRLHSNKHAQPSSSNLKYIKIVLKIIIY